MRRVIGLLGLLLLAAPAVAEEAVIGVHTSSPFYVDGKLLLAMCTADKNGNGPDMCEAYIAGDIDTVVANRDMIQGYHICWPHPALSLTDLRGKMVDYLRAHSEMTEAVASSIINSMLFEAFHCPGTTAPPG